jgi:hypothetical protein
LLTVLEIGLKTIASEEHGDYFVTASELRANDAADITVPTLTLEVLRNLSKTEQGECGVRAL